MGCLMCFVADTRLHCPHRVEMYGKRYYTAAVARLMLFGSAESSRFGVAWAVSERGAACENHGRFQRQAGFSPSRGRGGDTPLRRTASDPAEARTAAPLRRSCRRG